MRTVFFIVWFVIWIVGFCWGGEQFKDPGGLLSSVVFLIWFFGWIMAGIRIGDWLEEKTGPYGKIEAKAAEPTYEELLQRLQELQSENTTREQVERDTTSSEVISMGPYKLNTRVASYPQLVQFSRLEYEQYRLASEETFKAPPVVFLGSAWEVEISSVGGWVHGITAQSASDPLTMSLLRKSAFRHYQNKFGEPTKTGPGVAVWQSRSGQIDLCHDEEDNCSVIIGLTSASGATQESSPVS